MLFIIQTNIRTKHYLEILQSFVPFRLFFLRPIKRMIDEEKLAKKKDFYY